VHLMQSNAIGIVTSAQIVEWIICVWQRLNEGLAKLGLLDIVFGPGIFLSCPVEPNKPNAILR